MASVFLSFRGVDTRYNFTDHLYNALCQRGFDTFGVRDDDGLRKGEEISPALVKAIEESRVSIIVLSENYASSRLCLDELVKILECSKSKGQVVRSVFYKVDPSDVRYQTGSFGDAFATLDQGRYKDSVGKWKAALTEAADLSGWSIQDGKYLRKFIVNIVEELSARVNLSYLLNVAGSSANHRNHYTYDVFLSFRGDDNLFKFTDHLYTALCQRGIATFRDDDDDKLSMGEGISAALVKAIEESRVSIIVFSQNYASSSWCLDELVKVMECRQTNGQDVRPVFYKVDPSHVRHQIGAFGDAFAKLDQCRYKYSIGKWRKALKDAADLSGWPIQDGEYESESIKKIVDDLSAQVIDPSYRSGVAAHPIGLESYRQDVTKLLHVEEKFVRFVGIWGFGGIGKTTIAKHVFNSIRHKFEGSCFLADVRSKSTSDGLAKLQETLLVAILRDQALKVSSVDEGISFIKTRMRHKKVLIILDDASDSSQLQKLTPSSDCFGLGSRIIITTRDKQLLTAHRVDEVYEAKMLDDSQSLELFSWNAFKRNEPPGDYLDLAQCAVNYARGLPLALTVLGSHLFRRGRDEWEATLDSRKLRDPDRGIQDILKISYDALGVDLQGYFLDIACFFKGKYVDDVRPILEASYDLKSAAAGIAQLQQKALIRIERDTEVEGDKIWKIWMHDLIEEMGRDIVFQESPDEPAERSRLWLKDDVAHVLTNNTGTNKIIGIHVEPYKSMIYLNAKSFSAMQKHRCLYTEDYEKFFGEIDYLSNELRWLDWRGYSPHVFPSGFYADKLVKLNISDSDGITQLWEGRKKFSGLTSMNLSGCDSLTILPDFSEIPNLKELNVFDCKSLVEVPESLGLLDKLVTLNVDHCSNLIKFPRKINLKSAVSITITYCKLLEEFSEVGEGMCSLRSLELSGNPIKKLHPSITKLLGLKKLILRECYNLTTLPYNVYELHNLEFLDANFCSSLVTFPVIPIKMDSLKVLDLCGSDIRVLDESIGNLVGLECLYLHDCRNLRTLPCSIYRLQNLRNLYLDYCPKLVRFPTNADISNVHGVLLSLPKLAELSLGGCSRLSDCDFLMTLDCWKTLEYLDLSGNNFVRLPACFNKFVNLRLLDLRGCKRLQEIPGLPPKVMLEMRGCEDDDQVDELLYTDGASTSLDMRGCEDDQDDESFDIEVSSPSSLRHSDCREITRVWDEHKKFSWLISLNLSGRESPTELPDFSGILNLKELDLSHCKSVVEVPDFLGLLDKLVTLNVDRCSNLIKFPKKVNWKYVETISTRYCKLEEFSEVGEAMCSLISLDLSGTSIKELHPSITNLIGLEKLILRECYNLTTLPCNIHELCNLKVSDESDCPKLAAFPVIPRKMDSMRRLHLGGTCIEELHESIENLTGLEVLDLSECKNLETLPCSIYGLQHLRYLYLGNCSKLVTFPTNTNISDGSLSFPELRYLSIRGCSSLSDCDFLMTLDCWETLDHLDLSRNNFVGLPACFTNFVNLRELYLWDCKELREIPELPPHVDLDIKGIEWLGSFPKLSNHGAVLEAVSPLSEEEPTLSFKPLKRRRTA